MKKYIKFKFFGLFLLLIAFASCDTAEQDVADIISPDYKPKVTVTSNKTGTVNEGEVVTYTITLDKTIDRAITFTPTITGGTADDHDFDEPEPVVLEPYTTSISFDVVTHADIDNEATETIDIQLEILSIADKFLVHPDVVLAPIKLSIKDLGVLKIKFQWTNFVTNDYDIVTWNATTTPLTEWGDGGATGKNPEFDNSIMLADPIGTYYVNIMEWGYEEVFNYTFTITHPDNSVQTITGSFDGSNLSLYTNDPWKAWGGSYDSFRVLKVVNDGTKFVVTKL